MGFGRKRDIFVRASGAQKYDAIASDNHVVTLEVTVDKNHMLPFTYLKIAADHFYENNGRTLRRSVYRLSDGLKTLKTLTIEFDNGNKINEYITYGDI